MLAARARLFPRALKLGGNLREGAAARPEGFGTLAADPSRGCGRREGAAPPQRGSGGCGGIARGTNAPGRRRRASRPPEACSAPAAAGRWARAAAACGRPRSRWRGACTGESGHCSGTTAPSSHVQIRPTRRKLTSGRDLMAQPWNQTRSRSGAAAESLRPCATACAWGGKDVEIVLSSLSVNARLCAVQISCQLSRHFGSIALQRETQTHPCDSGMLCPERVANIAPGALADECPDAREASSRALRLPSLESPPTPPFRELREKDFRVLAGGTRGSGRRRGLFCRC